MRTFGAAVVVALVWGGAIAWRAGVAQAAPQERVTPQDEALTAALAAAGFTGRIESTLEARLGRPVDRELADLGRLVFFDEIQGLHDDNSCAGCHTPAFAFGDSQSIAIGVQNNGIVGPGRRGPRNQRKAPPLINSAFYPKQMLTGSFNATTVVFSC